MTCHVCAYEFCWLCGGEYKNGDHFTILNGCSYYGKGASDYLLIALLLPALLCVTPLVIGCILSKSSFEKCPAICCIIWIPLLIIATVLGFAMVALSPLFYILVAFLFVKSMIRQCKFR